MSPEPDPIPDDVIQVGEATWAVYGHSTYDGEVIIGEYDDPAAARAALRTDDVP
jgi:hypothetical protein